MTNVIPFNRFLEEREKRVDPKGYASRKVWEAIDSQVKANEAAKPLLIGTTEVIDDGFDDAPVFDKTLCWGTLVTEYMQQYPVTRKYLADDERQSDPGDETDI